MALRVLLVVLVFILSAGKAGAQKFYVSTGPVLHRITVGENGCSSVAINTCTGAYFQTIALRRNIMYYTDGYALHRGRIFGDMLVDCELITPLRFSPDALTVDASGILYAVQKKELYRIDPQTSAVTFLGEIPFSSAGDLIFYDRGLYFAAEEGIVEVNLANPRQSRLIIPMAAERIYGLAAVLEGRTIKVYGLKAPNSSEVVALDLVNRRLTGDRCRLPFFALDAASIVESAVLPPIIVDDIRIRQECSTMRNGNVEIVTEPGVYTFTLNNSESNTSGVFTNLAPGTYALRITKDDGSEEETSFTVNDFSLNKPVISYTKRNPKCSIKGQLSVNISGDGRPFRVVYNSQSYPADHVFSGLSAGRHHFDVVNQYGCVVQSDEILLEQEECSPIIVSGVLVQQDCDFLARGRIQLVAEPSAFTYTYALADGRENNSGLFTNLEPGSYTVTITSAEGNSLDYHFTVPEYPYVPLSVDVEKKDQNCAVRGEVKIDVRTPGEYRIKFGTGTYPGGHVFRGLQAGTYHFDIVDIGGCVVDAVEVRIALTGDCDPVSFPSVFSPNGDGINDYFRPTVTTWVSNYRLRLFNRWGAEMIVLNSVEESWNGEYKGGQASVGVYYFIVTYTTNDGRQHRQKGNVSLVR